MNKKKKLMALLISIAITLQTTGCGINILAKKDDNITTSISDVNTTKEVIEDQTVIETTTEELITEPAYYEDNKMIYTTDSVNLRKEDNTDSEIITVIDAFTPIKQIRTNGKWNYVIYNDNEGYVSSEYVEKLTDTYVEVDISDQKLKLYNDEELLKTCDVVTGKKGVHDTRYGCNPIYKHYHDEKGIPLRGNDPGDKYTVYVYYWMAFDGGQGIHDADNWRHGNYGGNIYKTNGSHGCVSVCYSDAEFIYDNTNKGDYVLVHE